MNHQQFHSRNLNLVLALGCAVAFGACGGSSRPKGGTGGAGGIAGATGNGGANGGAGGVGTGNGGTTGLGGGSGADAASTTPPSSCASAADCAPSGTFCELKKQPEAQCVQCVKSSDCPSGSHCFANQCVAAVAGCNDSRDCPLDKICDLERGLCVQCAKAADCGADGGGQDCVDNKCVTPVVCSDSRDCTTDKVCNPTSKRCVECVSDGDCNPAAGTATAHCVGNTCRPVCTSDKQCRTTNPSLLCGKTSQVCIECESDDDCPSSSYCDKGGMCKADICDSTQPKCSGNNLVQCNAAGNGWAGMTNCPADKPCKAFGGAAGCGGPPVGVDGGQAVDGEEYDGGGTCGSPAADVCKVGGTGGVIAKNPAAAIVDGRNDDICGVPYFQIKAADLAAKGGRVINYNNVPLTQFETATVWVAWGNAGLHVFADVQDSSVQTVAMAGASQDDQIGKSYQGDSIEIFATSNNTVTGLTGKDTNSLHIIVPASGPAVTTKTDNGSSGSPSKLPDSQYKQVITATGYAIEALLPWPGGTAPTSGATIRFDIALNSADKTFGNVDDMRDGQLLYFVGTVSGSTTCQGGDGTVPYCDDRTWCQAQLQ